jgi:hypothetical protein
MQLLGMMLYEKSRGFRPILDLYHQTLKFETNAPEHRGFCLWYHRQWHRRAT